MHMWPHYPMHCWARLFLTEWVSFSRHHWICRTSPLSICHFTMFRGSVCVSLLSTGRYSMQFSWVWCTFLLWFIKITLKWVSQSWGSQELEHNTQKMPSKQWYAITLSYRLTTIGYHQVFSIYLLFNCIQPRICNYALFYVWSEPCIE